MAEGYAKLYLDNKFNVYSAGIEKHGLNTYTIKVMEEDSVDIENQYLKKLKNSAI